MSEHSMKKFSSIILLLTSISIFAESNLDRSLQYAQDGDFINARAVIIEDVENDDREAKFWLARYYRDPNGFNNLEKGIELLIELAEDGYAEAQFEHGFELAKGWQNHKDEEILNVVYWLERATENNHPDALIILGVILDFEERDFLKEIKALAEKGNAKAQFTYGHILGRGILSTRGYQDEPSDAKKWIIKSSQQGFKPAIDFLEKLKS